MDLKGKATISWSGGKDCALALHRLKRQGEFQIAHIHSVVEAQSRRIGLHGIREELIASQATMIGLPLITTYLESKNNSSYEHLVYEMYQRFRAEGITHVVFGDIYLEDLRAYRQKIAADCGLIPIFPLWKMDPRFLLNQFIADGFRAVLCAVNEQCHSAGLLGRNIDNSFLSALPQAIDPCGENGEFHTFVWDSPLFSSPIQWRAGEESKRQYSFSVVRDGKNAIEMKTFYFQDIIPDSQS